MGQHDKANEGIDTWRREQLRQFVDKLTLDANACIRWALLDQALTDISLSAEYNNQHLEFFGDAVLRLAAAAFLREHYSQ
ncbi:MAG: hypothetical protein AAFU84_22630, partial [Cyanobacteria bacterium J06633_23]